MVALWIDASALDNADQDDHDTEGAQALLEAISPPEWHADAACREHPAEWWFPARGESNDRARAICDTCLVRAECLEASLYEPAGFWAGTTPNDRVALRRSAA